jgi:uncharacterized protein YcgI (DUF1989 family)
MDQLQSLATKQPPYQLDRAFYEKVQLAKLHYTRVEKLVIPPYSGRGFIVKKGQTFRVIQETGPQIADVAFWNAHNRKERFNTMQTWQVEGWVVLPFTRLWSDLPWFRPMMTCVDDTVDKGRGHEYHHHFIGTHCSPERVEMRSGLPGLNGCRLNLLQGIEPFGLTEDDLRDNINVHEKDRLDPKTGRRSIGPSDGNPGDYIEFYAEMDLLVSVSTCPFADGSSTSNPTRYRERLVRPLGIEVYETGIEPKAFPAWTDWRPAWTGKWVAPVRQAPRPKPTTTIDGR